MTNNMENLRAGYSGSFILIKIVVWTVQMYKYVLKYAYLMMLCYIRF